MKFCIRNVCGLIGCIWLALLSSQLWAVSETFHFYRMTGAGTWEHLNNLTFLSADGNGGSIELDSETSGPSSDELAGLLASCVTECIKAPVESEANPDAPPHCPVVANSFFQKLPESGKKLKTGKSYSLRKYQVAAGERNTLRETFVNDRKVDRIPLAKWNESALFHKLLYDVLRYNTAVAGGGMLEDVNDEMESGIKGKKGVKAAAKFAKKEHDRTDDFQESWLNKLDMVRSFFSSGQPYLDLVFGTSCQWRISIIHSAGVFKGLQFENEGTVFLLLMGGRLKHEKGCVSAAVRCLSTTRNALIREGRAAALDPEPIVAVVCVREGAR